MTEIPSPYNVKRTTFSPEDIIRKIAAKHMIRIEQWRDQYRHWRVGVDWYTDADYICVVEKPTLEEALEHVYDYLLKGNYL